MNRLSSVSLHAVGLSFMCVFPSYSRFLLPGFLRLEVGKKKWPENLAVEDRGALELRVVQPNKERNLEVKVHGDKIRDESKGLFDNGKGGKDHPVGQPLNVILGIWRIESLKGHVCRVDKAGKVDHQFGSANKEEQDGDNRKEAEKEIHLGEASLVF